ncbi:hypothetical protein D3C71_2248860 [compost metagenome]
MQAVILITMFIGSTPGISQVSLVPMPKLTLIRSCSARYSPSALERSSPSEKIRVLLFGSIPSCS